MTAVPPGPAHPRRRAVLEALRAAMGPLGVTDVATRVGIHPNTARFHLDTLVAEGAVESASEEPSGPGRPRTVYAPRRGMDRGGARGYQLLAEVLVSRLSATEQDAAAEAAEAGRAWGRCLVEQPPPFQRVTEEEARNKLTVLLDDLGFAPEPIGAGSAPDRMRLRNCPFLELAEAYGPVVCSLHLGLVQGALGELRSPLVATGVEPFAEADVCVTHLTTAAA